MAPYAGFFTEILDDLKDYIEANFGFDCYGCGLCQTGVPCESKIPTADDLKA